LPILFAEIGDNVIFATDTAFLGRVGTTELAAIALGDTAIELLAVPAVAVVEAMQMVISRRVGERRDETVGRTFSRALMLVVLIAVLVAAALKLGAPAAAQAVTNSDAIAGALDEFLQIAAFGVVLMAVNFALSSLFVALGRARALVGATLVLTVTNLGLSWVLILGELGAPRLGMQGAAWAFVGAECAALLYMTAYALRRYDLSRYGPFRPGRRGAPLVRPLARLASPMAFQFLVEAGRWFAFFLILEQVSGQALALASLVYACYAVLTIPVVAFDETAYSLVSRLIGQGQQDRIGPLMRRSVGFAYLVTAPLLVLVVLFPETVLSIFTSDQDAVEGARTTVRVAALALTIVIPAQLWRGALNGTGDADAAFVVELLWSVVMLAITALVALQLDLRLEYVWLAVPAAALVALAASYGYVRSGRWRRSPI
jgi:multidrug resistance protein, MATE family